MLERVIDGNLLPHGYCIAWDPWLLMAFVAGNLLIALAYFTIPLVILRFIRQRSDLDFRYLHWLFAAFIVTCGITHFLHVVELWYPVYHLEAVFDLLTAAISLISAVMLWRILPVLVSMPSSRELQTANQRLESLSHELGEKETQLRNLGDSLPDSYLFQFVREDGVRRFLYVSNGVQRLHGVSPEAVLRDAAVLLGQMAPEQRAAYDRAEEDSQRDLSDLSFEFHVLRGDGVWRWVQWRARPRRLADGQVVWDGIAVDVTDRHFFEDEINRLAQAVEQNPTGISITNAQGDLEYVNAACTRITGFQFGQAYARSRRDRISSEMTDAQYAEANACLEAGKPWSAQLPNRRRDGRLYWEQITVSPVYDSEGKVRNYLYLRQDITGQKTAEDALKQRSAALQRAHADLARFADVSAHHLMEPTRRLMVYASRLRARLEKLAGAGQDEEVREMLTTLEHEAERLRILVRDIQLYLAASQPRGEVRQADARAALEQAERQLAVVIEEQGAHIVVQGELPPACIDRPRFADLFAVLLDNALKHGVPMAQGARQEIVISGECDGKLSRYRISDNGPGIPAEYRERVFGIFERLSAASPGSGIGLAIAQRIVESCNGRIWIDDTAQGGTMVVFELPTEGQE